MAGPLDKPISELTQAPSPVPGGIITVVVDPAEAGPVSPDYPGRGPNGRTLKVAVDAMMERFAFARSFATLDNRNALPTAQRREGMFVYVVSNQVTYQLLPPPWNGTNTDWALLGQIPAYTPPSLLDFWIGPSTAGSDVSYIGPKLGVGSTITGPLTFQWRSSGGTNWASLTIRNITGGTVLASGLTQADSYVGSATVNLPAPITGTVQGQTQTFRITGTDLKGATASLDFVITWVDVGTEVYYVRTDGNDSNPGTSNSPSGAFATIQRAVQAVTNAGATINVVGPGNFAGCDFGRTVYGAPSGCQGHPIRIVGSGGATINAAGPNGQHGINGLGCSYVEVDGMRFTAGIPQAAIRFSSNGESIYGIKITNCNIDSAGRFGILGGYGCFSQISSNIVTNTIGSAPQRGHGIYWSNALRNATISDNVVRDNDGDGIHFNGGDASFAGTRMAELCLVTRNVVDNCNRLYNGSALNPDGFRDSVVTNNLMYNLGRKGVTLYRIDARLPSTGNVIANNTICLTSAATGYGAIQMVDASTNNTVFNNILYSAVANANLRAHLLVSQDSLTGLKMNYDLYLGTVGVLLRDANGNDNVSSLPDLQVIIPDLENNSFLGTTANTFTDFASEVFTIATDGPAFNAGTPSLNGKPAPTVDILNTVRPKSILYDIGCYEIVPGVVVSAFTPTSGSINQSTGTAVTFTFSENVISGSIVFALAELGGANVPGNLTYNSGTQTATFTPTSPLAADTWYEAAVTGATAVEGGTLSSARRWYFSTGGYLTLLNSAIPGGVDTDPQSISVGLRVYSTVAGRIRGVRFYKTAGQTGTHTARLYSVDQTTGGFVALLATKAFAGESASGWQSQLFDAPIEVFANIRFMVAVDLPDGLTSFTAGQFASAVTRASLVGPSTAAAGGNNNYAYPAGTFPSVAGGTGTGYAVDVLFEPTG